MWHLRICHIAPYIIFYTIDKYDCFEQLGLSETCLLLTKGSDAPEHKKECNKWIKSTPERVDEIYRNCIKHINHLSSNCKNCAVCVLNPICWAICAAVEC